MKRVLLIALLLLARPAHAGGIMNSATWLLNGKCNGLDQVYSWHIDGEPRMPTSFIYPWHVVPIVILGIELTKISGGSTVWWMAGNNIIGDTMLFLGPGENHGRHDFPAGYGMPMPAKAADDVAKLHYLDLHGLCLGDEEVKIFYTIYYTEQREAR